MSENKEILCPVCGHDTCIETGYYGNSKAVCQKCGLPYVLWEQIQSRIDRAEEEAVRKERESSIVMYGIYEGSSHDGGGCHAELYRTIEEVQSAIDLYVAKQAINETFIWQKFEGEHDIGGWHYGRIDVGDTSFEYETIAIQEFRIT